MSRGLAEVKKGMCRKMGGVHYHLCVHNKYYAPNTINTDKNVCTERQD